MVYTDLKYSQYRKKSRVSELCICSYKDQSKGVKAKILREGGAQKERKCGQGEKIIFELQKKQRLSKFPCMAPYLP